jgi:hypothetical protein
MIDTQSETLLTRAQGRREIPSRTGRTVSVSTVWRWAIRGCRGVKLETVVCGAIRYTSREAIHRFFAACTAAADGAPAPSHRNGRQRQKSIEAAERELSEAGL